VLRQSEARKPAWSYRYQVELMNLLTEEPVFWMGGRLAYDLQEISHDPSCLDDPGFWAVSATFEGDWTCARFAKVMDSPLPPSDQKWNPTANAWRTSLNESDYISYVQKIREQIAQGWVYQVNACRELFTEVSGKTLLPLMHQILKKNPAPFASYLKLPDVEIASASPELFLKRVDAIVTSAPIKGTKPPEMDGVEFGAKDQAENVMIVDLIRNDLGRICQIGSVHVPRLLETQPHPGLSHLVSYVEGSLRDDIGWPEISSALLPPGSVSGAPKSSAIKMIGDLEGQSRGPYCGPLGWVEDGEALLSLAIRIFWTTGDGTLRFGTGAGVTWSSSPEGEWEETELKARRLISIAKGEIL
jgi:para-aminobenzoate synthetase component 1